MKQVVTISLAFVTLCMVACKKGVDAPALKATRVCSLQSIVNLSDISYDSLISTSYGGVPGYRQLSKPIYNGVYSTAYVTRRDFLLDGNKIYIVDSPAWTTRDTLIVDRSMRILEKRRMELSSYCGSVDTILTSWKYESDNTGQLWRIVYYQVNLGQYTSGRDTLFFTFANGDLTSVIEHGKTIITYTYYQDLPQPASFTSPAHMYINNRELFNSGAFEFRNAHLLKSLNEGSNYQIDYRYVFNEVDGKILKIISTQQFNGKTSTRTETYNYFCN